MVNTNQRPPSSSTNPPSVNTNQRPPPSSSTNSTMDDDDVNSPNHPLFLHQQDHPGLVLISKKLTRSDNYGSWKRSMMIALNTKNKMKIINGNLQNQRINGERDLRKRLVQFLMGLDECYANIRGQILLMNPMPTIAKAYSMIRNSYNNNARGGRNYNQCESLVRGTSNSHYQIRKGVFKKGVICGSCSKEGHIREECYKLVGYPIGHPLYGKYKPPNTPKFTTQDNSVHKSINMTVTQGNT
nr:UBN2_3 domain-containing protein [Tanacetum cinerariifolium]